MNFLQEEHLKSIVIPANLRINDQINRYRRQCRLKGCPTPYYHFAFGQSPFSPPPPIIEALAANAHRHDYLPTAGLPELRETIAAYYKREFDFVCKPEQIVISPGSKEMIAILLAVLKGPLVIPTPSWVSYLPQAKILKKEVISLRVKEEDHYKLTPENLAHGLEHTHAEQRVLILNSPHNPTGAVYTWRELEALAKVCRKFKVIVISDEIYAKTSFHSEEYVSMMRVYPEGTIVTGGLSKDRSCGGYRMGVGVFPADSEALVTDVLKIAGSTYSCVAAPIQYAAIKAYSPDKEIEDYVNDCRDIHAMVGKKTAAMFNAIPGVKASPPHGAFYLFADFNEHKESFLELGLNTCAEFCEDLLAVDHAALLPGESLLLQKDDFAVRASYVDYDGDRVLEQWRKKPPSTPDEEEFFFNEYCPLIPAGIKHIARYITEISEGRRPKHM